MFVWLSSDEWANLLWDSSCLTNYLPCSVEFSACYGLLFVDQFPRICEKCWSDSPRIGWENSPYGTPYHWRSLAGPIDFWLHFAGSLIWFVSTSNNTTLDDMYSRMQLLWRVAWFDSYIVWTICWDISQPCTTHDFEMLSPTIWFQRNPECELKIKNITKRTGRCVKSISI